jgi:hypothetical protein
VISGEEEEGSDEETQPEEAVAEWMLNAKDHRVNVPPGRNAQARGFGSGDESGEGESSG